VVVFSLQRLSETFLILRIQHDSLIYVHRTSCKIPVILVGFQRNLNFFEIFSKNGQISNFMKVHPVGAELCNADGQTEETSSRFSEGHECA
jgi:hypothetical protein